MRHMFNMIWKIDIVSIAPRLVLILIFLIQDTGSMRAHEDIDRHNFRWLQHGQNVRDSLPLSLSFFLSPSHRHFRSQREASRDDVI